MESVDLKGTNKGDVVHGWLRKMKLYDIRKNV